MSYSHRMLPVSPLVRRNVGRRPLRRTFTAPQPDNRRCTAYTQPNRTLPEAATEVLRLHLQTKSVGATLAARTMPASALFRSAAVLDWNDVQICRRQSQLPCPACTNALPQLCFGPTFGTFDDWHTWARHRPGRRSASPRRR